jgi:hypothetical protein
MITCSTLPRAMELRVDLKRGKTFGMAQLTQMQPEIETEGVAKKPRALADGAPPGWRTYVNAFLAAEISALTRYYDRVIQWLPREDDKGGLLAAIDAPRKETVGKDEPFPDLTHERDKRTAILIN